MSKTLEHYNRTLNTLRNVVNGVPGWGSELKNLISNGEIPEIILYLLDTYTNVIDSINQTVTESGVYATALLQAIDLLDGEVVLPLIVNKGFYDYLSSKSNLMDPFPDLTRAIAVYISCLENNITEQDLIENLFNAPDDEDVEEWLLEIESGEYDFFDDKD